MVKRLISDSGPTNLDPTVGVEYVNKVFEMKSGGRLMAQIWDTAGQAKYKSICRHHYRNAVGAAIVFDLTKKSSFESVGGWIQDFRGEAHEKACQVIVGSKLDLVQADPARRQVTRRQGEELARQHDSLYLEVSATSNTNVYEALEALLEEVYLSVNSFNPHDAGAFGLTASSALETRRQSESAEPADKCCYI